MRKLILVAGIVVAGTLGAAAQQPTGQTEHKGGTTGQHKSSTTGATTTTAGQPKAAATTTPAPAAKVFVPVAVPKPPTWNKNSHPYAARHHNQCQEKAHNLSQYERHAAADGHLSSRERRTISALKHDLDRTCGGFRWRN